MRQNWARLDTEFRRFWRALTRKKAINRTLIADSELERNLSVMNLTIIGVGATLGISIYILLGQTARDIAGPGIVVSLIIDAIAALMSGVCYAELAARIPIAGSAYTYTNATMGEALAFFVSWNLLFEYSIGTALFARGFTGYLNSIMHGKFSEFFKAVNLKVRFLDFETNLDFPAASLCLILTMVIVFGWEPTNILIISTVVGSVSVIIFILIVGTVYGSLENWFPFMPFGLLGVIKGASTCFYAFVGYDVIAMSAEETINPVVTIPAAIITSICISVVLFVGVAVVLTLMVPYHLLTVDATLVVVFQRIGLNFAGYIVFLGMVLGTIGGLTATLIPLPRLVYAMSKDGLLFSFLSKVHSVKGTACAASITAGVFTALIALCFDTPDLVKMMSMGTLIAYSSVCLCVILLRYRIVNVCLHSNKEEAIVDEVKENDDQEIVKYFEDQRERVLNDKEKEARSSLGGDFPEEGSNEDHDESREGGNKGDPDDPQEGCSNAGHYNSSEVGSDSDTERIKGEINCNNEEEHSQKKCGRIPFKSISFGENDDGKEGKTAESKLIADNLKKIKGLLSSERYPNETTETVVNLSCFCLVVQMVAICSIVIYGFENLILMELSATVGLSVITASTIFNLFLIAVQPENRDPLFFRVPLVPWLPALSLFVNIYLIMLLNRGSWIRFGIWLVIGIIVYFGYGIHHSKAGHDSQPIYTKLNQ